MAEHGLTARAPVIGVAFDGTGYGTTAPSGAARCCSPTTRVPALRALRYVPLPGGDAAVRRPYRMALAHLRAAGVAVGRRPAAGRGLPAGRAGGAAPPARHRIRAASPTSSMGRLFDAVAALAGVRQVVGLRGAGRDRARGPRPRAVRATSGCAPARTAPSDGPAALPRGATPRRWSAPSPPTCAPGSPAGVIGRAVPRRRGSTWSSSCRRRAAAAQQRARDSRAHRRRVPERAAARRPAPRRLRADGFTVLCHRHVPPERRRAGAGPAASSASVSRLDGTRKEENHVPRRTRAGCRVSRTATTP